MAKEDKVDIIIVSSLLIAFLALAALSFTYTQSPELGSRLNAYFKLLSELFAHITH